ncbi:electron transport complex subunit RsxC [Catenovulum maritimum]|uniref:Ion-translocating oxidoreductase complex subunit C n=1 Tax=Catenovulum maritimum TaxID=1513271 RepID=A0A0J8JKF7_9ALTE|nr:electron transport complex subunit RsxC [Catenovulum maritimum]KMT64956.1 electron transporter RnfC [Catenovulum maritimum]
MDSLIDKIKSGYLWDFPGGVFPPERKSMSLQTGIQVSTLPDLFYIPIKQHIGKTDKILVKPGDTVLKGQALSQSLNHMTLPVHSPTSGTVEAIEPHTVAHPSGLSELCIIIKPDGLDASINLSPCDDYSQLTKPELLDKLQQAGIAGLGGAAFPTYVKQANSQPIDVLIINAVECEPYITADDSLMREHSEEIVKGIQIFEHLLKPELVVIAIEKNKPEAIEIMEQAISGLKNYLVRAIPTKYPAGGEKQLIQVITGKEVPSGGITADIGVICQNVATAHAAYKAVTLGQPLIERVVTITGEQVTSPTNLWVKIGTPVSHLLAQQGYQALAKPRVIMGGPMMGFTLASDEVPITKISNCILAPSDEALPEYNNEQACIRCSACADACPASLLPQQLYWHSKAKEYDKAQSYSLFDCIECGACAYVCPSEIPLVQYYRVAKSDIKAEIAEHKKAEKAKERFDARNLRLEQEKQARLDKHKEAAEQRRQAMEKNTGDKDKVAAALARVQALKAKQSTENNSPVQTADTTKSKAQAAIERAKAKKAQQQGAETSVNEIIANETAAPVNDAKSKAQAAIARAKAKKLATEQAKTENNERPEASEVQVQDQAAEISPAKAKAMAAIARAKAKKLAAEQAKAEENSETSAAETVSESAQTPSVEEANTTANTSSPAKAKAMAAVARAKAKKLAAEQAKTENKELSENPDTPTQNQEADISPAKAKAMAAVARAKAKKLAAEQNQQQAQSEEVNSEDKSDTDPAVATATEQNSEPQNPDNLTPEQKAKAERDAKIKATIAKAKAKRKQMENP